VVPEDSKVSMETDGFEAADDRVFVVQDVEFPQFDCMGRRQHGCASM
jgi:hypothetical protein